MSERRCHHQMLFSIMNGMMIFGYASAFLGSPLWVFPAMAIGAYVGYRVERRSAAAAEPRAAEGEGS